MLHEDQHKIIIPYFQQKNKTAVPPCINAFGAGCGDGRRSKKAVLLGAVLIADGRELGGDLGTAAVQRPAKLVKAGIVVPQLGVDIGEQDDGIVGNRHDEDSFRVRDGISYA